jgi:DNA invertase Pin-like site-specific DNA recombinase
MRTAIYCRVSTQLQEPLNQQFALRKYCEARSWSIVDEFVDHGVSGMTDSRPQLDRLMKAARRRSFDLVLVAALDRLGRNLRHLIVTMDEFRALGVGFASLNEGIDTTTPAGKLQLHVLAAISEFEFGRLQERIRLGMARAKAQGRHLGRPRPNVTDDQLIAVESLSVRQAASRLGISKSFVHSWRLSRRVAKFRVPDPSNPAHFQGASTNG